MFSSMMNALDKNEVVLKNNTDKTKIIDSLKASLDNLNLSPKIKLNSERARHGLSVDNKQEFKIDEISYGKERRHYNQHPNNFDNVKFDYKENYTSPNERIEELINYYAKIGEDDRNYKFNPQMHSFYKKEQLDPLIKYSKKIRHVDVSPDNPFHRYGNKLFYI